MTPKATGFRKPGAPTSSPARPLPPEAVASSPAVHRGSTTSGEAARRSAGEGSERADSAPVFLPSHSVLTTQEGSGKGKPRGTEPQNVAAHSPLSGVYSGSRLPYRRRMGLPAPSFGRKPMMLSLYWLKELSVNRDTVPPETAGSLLRLRTLFSPPPPRPS